MTNVLPPALILAAGLGTRLRPLTYSRAKAAVPVAGIPLIRRQVTKLTAAGIREVVVNLHHRPETIAAVLGDGHTQGCQIRYSWEREVLGSAGGPRHALPLLDSQFFLVNGDTLTNVDLNGLWNTHVSRGARVTLAVTTHPAPDRYGGIVANTDERMQGVWVQGSKVGSVGLAFRKWVSRHGFTINFATPKGRVEALDGCGLNAGTTTSLDRLGVEISADELTDAMLGCMQECISRKDAKS
mgnify:CR=1 FL=1